ncbi:MAG: segregation/condensation protein A [Elusimicrobiota bacterium]|jgi:segregation and condensation protein A|nr:segregation/condensation protein A [Elusimicrobiota bacterium]
MLNESIKIHLDVFEGPMDLLLHLIKKDNLDIYDVNISEITAQYLAYLDVMKELNLEIAGDFLVMASTLMQIKAKQLLPSQAPTSEEDGPDPAKELIEKIVEYQKFKEASKFLEGNFDKFKDNFYKNTPIFDSGEKVLNVQLFDLLAAVRRAFDQLEERQHADLLKVEEFPIEKKMEKVLSLFEERDWVLIEDVFRGETKKRGVLTCFLAVLELLKVGKIFARQDKQNTEIRLYLNPDKKDLDFHTLLDENSQKSGELKTPQEKEQEDAK